MSYYIFFDEPAVYRSSAPKPTKFAIRYHWSNPDKGEGLRWSVTEIHELYYGSAQLGLKQPEAEWYDGKQWRKVVDEYWEALKEHLPRKR